MVDGMDLMAAQARSFLSQMESGCGSVQQDVDVLGTRKVASTPPSTTDDTLALHRATVAFLDAQLATPSTLPTVVVTALESGATDSRR